MSAGGRCANFELLHDALQHGHGDQLIEVAQEGRLGVKSVVGDCEFYLMPLKGWKAAHLIQGSESVLAPGCTRSPRQELHVENPTIPFCDISASTPPHFAHR